MLSVILTSYNYARYLGAALDALAAQTVPPDELIVLDDASQDDSVAIVEGCLGRFPDARLVQNPRNLGIIANLNQGLALARGDIVYFAAADDITYPALLERGSALLAAHPDAALFSARSAIIDTAGHDSGVMATAMPLRQPGFLAPEAVARLLLRDDNWLTGNTTLYRRAPLLAAGGFAPELGSFCDGYVSRLLSLRHGACFSPEALGAWRRHAGGYAWSETADIERAERLVAAVTRRMETDTPPFPPGYARRWAGRYLFGAHRFVLRRRREAASARGPAAAASALVGEVATTTRLFLAYRPRDAFAVACRRLPVWRYRARRGRLATERSGPR